MRSFCFFFLFYFTTKDSSPALSSPLAYADADSLPTESGDGDSRSNAWSRPWIKREPGE